MERHRTLSLGLVGLGTGLLLASTPASAQVIEGLKRQAETAVVHKGGQVIREAIDCAVGEPQCDKPEPAPPAKPGTPAPPGAPTSSAAGASAAVALGQDFTATVVPWIARDTQGRDHVTPRATFTGDAVAGEVKSAEHHIVLCDPTQKWKGTLQFFFAGDGGIEPGEYPIVKRVQAGTTVMAGFFMPLATTFQEGTVTIDAAGPDVVTGTVRASYAASKYLNLQSGTPPETHELEASFRARFVPAITRESVPACFWQ